MKNLIGVITAAVIAVGLLIALIVIKSQDAEQHRVDVESMNSQSNKLTEDIKEEKQVATTLENDLAAEKKKFEATLNELTNNFTTISSNLTQTSAALETSEKEVKERDAKIADLEAQNQVLDKKANDLSTQIAGLTTQIEDTQKKLSASEGDRNFLQKELTRLIAEKEEYERQFKDINILRAQVAKLKDEEREARIQDYIRRGVYAAAQQKGAQRIMQGAFAGTPAPRPSVQTNYDLNVEVNADGTVKVIPPLTNPSTATNALPAK